jgi:hypothetical protein
VARHFRADEITGSPDPPGAIAPSAAPHLTASVVEEGAIVADHSVVRGPQSATRFLPPAVRELPFASHSRLVGGDVGETLALDHGVVHDRDG